jgi:hypothetical protein
VINTIATLALPTGNTLYEVWFGRKLPTDFLDYKESTRRARVALGATEGITESSASGEDGEDREDGEGSFFVDEEAE